MRLFKSREYRELAEIAEEQGWTVEMTRSGHVRWMAPSGFIYFSASTPSDHRAYLNLRSDLYSKGGWAAYADYRYALRYNFTGSFSGEYKKLHTGEDADPGRTEENSYRLNLSHNQTIDPTLSFPCAVELSKQTSDRGIFDTPRARPSS